jgi:multiple sugar transport system permease protein
MRGVLGRVETRSAYAFILPSIVVISFFWIYPSIWTVIYSFTKWDGINPVKFIGLENFKELFLKDELARGALLITLYYLIGTLPEAILIGLVLALVLNKGWLKGRQIFLAVYFLPVTISMIGVCACWMLLLDPMSGLLNWVIGLLGASPQVWLGDQRLAMASICFVSLWKWLGWFTVIYLAALQAVPQEYGEAARIDGASPFQEFAHITWPSLLPTTFFLSITGMIGAFQVFDQVFMMTRGGPSNSTYALMYYIYDAGLGRAQRMGYASALSTALLVVLLIATMLQWRFYTSRAETER